jgi:hypothetical protein
VQLLEQVQLWLYHDLAKKQLQLWSIRTVFRGYFMIDYTRSGGVFRLSRMGRVPSLVCGERWPGARRSLKKKAFVVAIV